MLSHHLAAMRLALNQVHYPGEGLDARDEILSNLHGYVYNYLVTHATAAPYWEGWSVTRQALLADAAYSMRSARTVREGGLIGDPREGEVIGRLAYRSPDSLLVTACALSLEEMETLLHAEVLVQQVPADQADLTAAREKQTAMAPAGLRATALTLLGLEGPAMARVFERLLDDDRWADFEHDRLY